MSCCIKLALIIGFFTFNFDALAEGKKGAAKEENAPVEERAPEEEKAPVKEYKNPFESLQKQRAFAQEKKAKAIQRATIKAGTKSKREPGRSKLVQMHSEKLGIINGKITKKYELLLKSFCSRIPRHSKTIKELKERMKMTSTTENTMNRIEKLELEIREMKQEFKDRVVAFEPVPNSLLKKYQWLKGL